MKYRCKICGSVFELKEETDCPICHANKAFIESLEKEEEQNCFLHAVKISENNLGIEKDDSKCIDCGQCKVTCREVTGLSFEEKEEYCLSCGQCILTCPTSALKPRSEKERVMKAIEEGKIVICYVSPAVRVSVGEAFSYEPGTVLIEELVGALFELGFSYVFDTTFGADLTIIEEASELKKRIDHNGVLPMITSCCPSWVKYAKIFYPEILDHISTCKSPIGMEGAVLQNYFLPKIGKKKEDVFTVAITPCTAKKMETKVKPVSGTDAVLTITEVISWMKEKKIHLKTVKKRSFSNLFGEGSGGGTLFGVTGGVMSSALRTFYYLETGKDLENVDFSSLNSYDSVKEFSFSIHGKTVRVAVVHQLAKAKTILEEIKKGVSPYQFIEIMNCKGGCIGGGGEPKYKLENEKEIKNRRMSGLVERDKNSMIRFAHQNPDIKRIYHDFLKIPNEEIAKKYLHTCYKED